MLVIKTDQRSSAVYMCFALAVFFLSARAYADQQIYRYVDENGVVSYSATPPPHESEDEAVRINLSEDRALAPDAIARERDATQQKYDDISKRLHTRRENQITLGEQIAAAKREVEAKREALERGREPRPGERVGMVNEYSRLRPVYFERIKRLENDLAVAEEKLEKLQRKQ